ncbi:MAG: LapA family protein [Candidatus Eisenbacteria bacterium]|uniref:LapA family protein n=1 Tax=Eiseniibacteriota bacterium TaxID=2212470 RepID=A0A948W676_UNCEI|nr:LapA family protein [Candidatus Eisenbacteria bacterium]MBU1947156.1 LapA family protein [Candidatus Eisenbacteria bacterium]MBU2691224.1 LapA family protein [Candidatus Eisenbacteria bacterium]
MWFLKTLVILIVVLVLLWCLLPNMNTSATISVLWPVSRSLELPLAMALFLAYFLGILTLYVISLARDLRMRTQFHRLKRENKQLQEEVKRMRRAPIEELEKSLEPSGRRGMKDRPEE